MAKSENRFERQSVSAGARQALSRDLRGFEGREGYLAEFEEQEELRNQDGRRKRRRVRSFHDSDPFSARSQDGLA